MKKIISALLAAAMILTWFAACESDKSGVDSQKPTADVKATVDTASERSEESAKTDDGKTQDKLEELPASVDLRDYNGKNYVTPVKRQAFGDCWSFGIAAAAESSYLYENDLGAPAGEDNTNANFSERYLNWYVYHGITKEDVKLGKVRSSQVGEGYDTVSAESENPNAVFLLGGALLSGGNMFASGFGPVDETTKLNGVNPYAYSDTNKVNNEDYEDYDEGGDWSIPLNAEYRNSPISAFLRNGNILPNPASKDSDGNYKFNEDGVRAIKSEIAKGHAVGVAALVYGRMNYDNWAAYTTTEERNHVVTIIGYDDNYPKENFGKANDDGEIMPDSVPPTDGAFIIKDSYGEMGGFDGKGTFYISYHDHTLLDPVSFDFDNPDDVKYTNLNYDQYDLLFVGWCGYEDYDSEAKMANVFDAQEDEYLTQIVYKTKKFNTSAHYQIYKSPEDGKPDSGTLLEEGDNVHEYAGFHKIDLKSVYDLKKGEKYSIVLTMTYTPEGGSVTYTNVIPYATNAIPYGISPDSQVIAKGVINKGESYMFNDGKWTDLTDKRAEFSEKALEDDNTRGVPENFKAMSIDRITIDNFPIKAILVPESEYRN